LKFHSQIDSFFTASGILAGIGSPIAAALFISWTERSLPLLTLGWRNVMPGGALQHLAFPQLALTKTSLASSGKCNHAGNTHSVPYLEIHMHLLARWPFTDTDGA
jgi:hypothetical protein